MKKLLSFTLLAFGLLCANQAQASRGSVAPKEVFLSPAYSLQITSVTPFTVLESTSGIKKPGAVYQVTCSTGVAGTFSVMFDTGTTTTTPGLSMNSNLAPQLGPRLYYNSTSASTVYTFDPPLIFFNGLMIGNSAVTEAGCAVTYELGRGLTGQ